MSELEHHIRWGKPGDGQGQRLGWLLGIALLVFSGVILFSTDEGEPAMNQITLETTPVEIFCASEDEVVVKVVVEAYDLDAGALRCVHIDQLRPERTTP